MRIEDYAAIGDTHTMAIVGFDGSIDWLCWPRFDSPACFAALLGCADHGCWKIAPRGPILRRERRYREDTLILETCFSTREGTLRLVDAMPVRGPDTHLFRIVEGVTGSVRVHSELSPRAEYGITKPWLRRQDGRVAASAGSMSLVLDSPTRANIDGYSVASDFEIRAGDRASFVLTWHTSGSPVPEAMEPLSAVERTESWWRAWSARCSYRGQYRDAVRRSLLTLKALTYAPTGASVAAPTTSLPETIGGARNWDYRYCWLRDATFTLLALLRTGYEGEARAFRDWLLHTAATDPSRLQIMYSLAGDRLLPELELDWLPGYAGSRPVRVGNDAARQLQLDVQGELIDSLYQARRSGIPPERAAWEFEHSLLDWLESHWADADDGIWEMRGRRRDYTHSKVMTWVAFDRAIKSVERLGLEGPVERWRGIRGDIHADICRNGFDRRRGAFTQTYGSQILDASLLLLPAVGFLPGDDPRVLGTVAAVERELFRGGLVHRYSTGDEDNLDGLPGKEGAFLACSFWLVDALVLGGRKRDARRLFERVLSLRNDVGLLSEEYDVDAGRLVGNFPQAFSHVALVNSAVNLSDDVERSKRGRRDDP